MSYLTLIEYALNKGCGVSFEDLRALDASRFTVETSRKARNRYFYPDGPSTKRLWHGYHRVAPIIQQSLTSGNLTFDPELVPQQPAFIAEQNLLRVLGTALITAATYSLPVVKKEDADIWHRMDTAQQKAHLQQFFSTFQAASTCQKDEDDEDPSPSEWGWLDQYVRPRLAEEVLPESYGFLGPDKVKPSCLGAAQMLVAYARHIGAPVMFASWLENPFDRKWRSEGAVCRALLRDIKRRHIICGEHFRTGLELNCQEATAQRLPAPELHHAIVIQYANQEWGYLDPYMGILGSLPEDVWRLNDIYARLATNASHFPGLTLVGHDGGYLRERLKAARQQIYPYLEQSFRFMVSRYSRFETTPKDIEDFLAFCRDEPSLAILMNHQRDPENRRRYTLSVFGPIIEAMGDELDERTVAERFATDDGFRFLAVDRIQSEFHRMAKRGYRDEIDSLKRVGEIVPTALELSLPEVNIALFTLNFLRRWHPAYQDLPTEWLVQHSSSQLLWQQCAARRYRRTTAQRRLSADAEQQVRALQPHIHPLCRRELQRSSTRRKRTNHA